jgi:hypothetical protein
MARPRLEVGPAVDKCPRTIASRTATVLPATSGASAATTTADSTRRRGSLRSPATAGAVSSAAARLCPHAAPGAALAGRVDEKLPRSRKQVRILDRIGIQCRAGSVDKVEPLVCCRRQILDGVRRVETAEREPQCTCRQVPDVLRARGPIVAVWPPDPIAGSVVTAVQRYVDRAAVHVAAEKTPVPSRVGDLQGDDGADDDGPYPVACGGRKTVACRVGRFCHG